MRLGIFFVLRGKETRLHVGVCRVYGVCDDRSRCSGLFGPRDVDVLMIIWLLIKVLRCELCGLPGLTPANIIIFGAKRGQQIGLEIGWLNYSFLPILLYLLLDAQRVDYFIYLLFHVSRIYLPNLCDLLSHLIVFDHWLLLLLVLFKLGVGG